MSQPESNPVAGPSAEGLEEPIRVLDLDTPPRLVGVIEELGWRERERRGRSGVDRVPVRGDVRRGPSVPQVGAEFRRQERPLEVQVAQYVRTIRWVRALPLGSVPQPNGPLSQDSLLNGK